MLTVIAIWFAWYVLAPAIFIGSLIMIFLGYVMVASAIENQRKKRRVLRAEKQKTAE